VTNDDVPEERPRLYLQLPPLLAVPAAIGLALAVLSSLFFPSPTVEWLATALMAVTVLMGLGIFLLLAFKLHYGFKLKVWLVASTLIVLCFFLVSIAGVIDGLFGTSMLPYLSELPAVRWLRPWYQRYDTILTFVDWVVLAGALVAYVVTLGSRYGEGYIRHPVHGPGCNCGCGCATLLYIAWIVAAGRTAELFQPLRDMRDLMRHLLG
jgi:hypothetical protein